MSSFRSIFCAAMLGLLCLVGHAERVAASSSPAVATAASSPPIFAEKVSWHGFVKYWRGFVKNSDRVVVVVALVALAALFIITRGKWMH